MKINYSKTSDLSVKGADANFKKWEEYFSVTLGKKQQWEDNKSAKTLAQYICSEGPFNDRNGIQEINTIIKQSLGIDSLEFICAQPEFKVAFDKYNKPREHDLAISATSGDKDLFIGIEAKVEESFGPTIKSIRDSIKKCKNPENSAKPERIKNLCQLFNVEENTIEECRYQLLYAIASCHPTVLPEGFAQGVMMFLTFKMKESKAYEKHKAEFVEFINKVKGKHIKESDIKSKLYCCEKYLVIVDSIEIYVIYAEVEKG